MISRALRDAVGPRRVAARRFRPALTFRYSMLFPRYRSRSMVGHKLVELVKAELARNPLLK